MRRHFHFTRPYARWLVAAALVLGCGVAHAELNVLIVEGLGGDPKYQQQFDKDVQAIRAASATLAGAEQVQVLAGEAATLVNFTAAMKQLAAKLTKEDRLILYLVGHGSHDGYEYKFNIPGPDLEGAALQKQLDAIKSESQLVVATGSSSGALQETLKKDSRVVLTATRSGNERNATHFGGLFAAALGDATVDADKNGRITAQEAFDFTARKVKDYFAAETKLATEHAQLSGARANLFAIAQLGNAAPLNGDPGLLAQRERLNSRLEELRLRKDSMSEDEYLQQLEPLMLEMAEWDARASGETVEGGAAGGKP